MREFSFRIAIFSLLCAGVPCLRDYWPAIVRQSHSKPQPQAPIVKEVLAPLTGREEVHVFRGCHTRFPVKLFRTACTQSLLAHESSMCIRAQMNQTKPGPIFTTGQCATW